jgi:hypothetical protein
MFCSRYGSPDKVQEYNVTTAYKLALKIWANWLESNIQPLTQNAKQGVDDELWDLIDEEVTFDDMDKEGVIPNAKRRLLSKAYYNGGFENSFQLLNVYNEVLNW